MSTSEESDDTKIGKSFLLMQEGLLEKHEVQWDLNIIPGTGNSTSSKVLDIIFESGPLADLEHSLEVNQPEANKTTSLAAQLELHGIDYYDEKTNRFTLADGRTMRITLDRAQIDFYSNGKIEDSHELTINKRGCGGTSMHWIQILPPRWTMKSDTAFTASQITGDMVRYRLFLQVETGSVEGSFLRSCLNAPDMFLSEHLSDVRVVCSNGNKSATSFPAHRFVLSYNSPVLNCMFQNDMKEAREGRIAIEDMSEASVKELLRFTYTGKFVVTDDSTFELYKAADKYDIKLLKRQCQDYLLQRLSIQNAMDVYMLGEAYNCNTLKDESFQFIKKHKNNIIENEGSLDEFHKKYRKILLKLIQKLL